MKLIALLGAGALGCASTPYTLWHARSPDRLHSLEIVEQSGKQYLRIDASTGTAHDQIAPSTLTFSADGEHLAYAAASGARWSVYVDHCQGSEWDGIGEIAFAPRGDRVAYAAERNGRFHVVVDERAGAGYPVLLSGTLRFSHDGHAVLYVAGSSQFRVIVEKHQGPAFDGIASLQASSDGSVVAYAARRGASAHVVVGGSETDPFERVRDLILSDDGQQFAFVGERDGRERLYVNGVARELDGADVVPHTLVFRPRRGPLSYWLRHSNTEYAAIVDGNVTALADLPAPIIFSADGRRVTFIARQRSVYDVMVDGRLYAREPWASQPVFSPDSSHFAYLAERNGHSLVVVDGTAHAAPALVDGSFAWSRDSRHWACLVLDAKRRAMAFLIDGRTRTPLAFRELAFAASLAAQAGGQAQSRADPLAAWSSAEANRVSTPRRALPFWFSGRCERRSSAPSKPTQRAERFEASSE